jgi:hypothetical protein
MATMGMIMRRCQPPQEARSKTGTLRPIRTCTNR